jgi:hypothetical protein
MVGLLIGLGIGFLVSVIIFSLLNYQVFYTFNPFYNFIDNVKGAGGVFLFLLLIVLPILGYAINAKYDCLEKCNVKWKFDEEIGAVKIDVTGSEVKDVVINFESKQN